MRTRGAAGRVRQNASAVVAWAWTHAFAATALLAVLAVLVGLAVLGGLARQAHQEGLPDLQTRARDWATAKGWDSGTGPSRRPAQRRGACSSSPEGRRLRRRSTCS